MYDKHIRYLASAFLNGGTLDVNSQELASLMQELSTKLNNVQMMPSIVQEEMPTGAVQRYAFLGIAGLWQWQIILASRFDVARVATNPFGGSDLGSYDDFCKQAAEALVLLLERFEKKPHRLAAVQEGFLAEMKVDETTAVAHRLMNFGQTYKDHALTEWDWRAVAQIPRQLGDLEEPVNTISTIKRIAGLSIRAGETSTTLPINRIRVDIDTNTLPSNTDARFETEDVRGFFRQAIDWHQQLTKELEALILGK